MVSQRFPEHFDGILACAPGFNLPKAAFFGHSWDVQALAEVSNAHRHLRPLRPAAAQQDVHRRGSGPGVAGRPRGLRRARRSGRRRHRRLPALHGGRSSRPKLDGRRRAGPEAGDVPVAGAGRARSRKLYAGARDAQGTPLLLRLGLGPRHRGQDRRQLQPGLARRGRWGRTTRRRTRRSSPALGSASVSAVFTTPPTPVAMNGRHPWRSSMGIDQQRDRGEAGRRRRASSPNPSLSFMSANSTDLTKFKARGGKLVIVHGVSDPVFSINDTIRLVERPEQRDQRGCGGRWRACSRCPA